MEDTPNRPLEVNLLHLLHTFFGRLPRGLTSRQVKISKRILRGANGI